jgi:hypothetical protein
MCVSDNVGCSTWTGNACHYAAPITLLKGLAEGLSVLSDLRVRGESGWSASGIGDPHVDGMLKYIINTFMGSFK